MAEEQTFKDQLYISSSEDSSDSENDFCPIGLAKSNISSLSQGVTVQNVFLGDVEENVFNFPTTLTYHSLLTRADGLFKKQLEEAEQRKGIKLKVVRKNRKTGLNLTELAIQINRSSDLLCKYILTRMNTKGTVNKQGYLTLDGKYLQSEFEQIFKDFIEIYVACKSCKNITNTTITKSSRLYFLKCNKCNASTCLGSVVDGLTTSHSK